jgi:phosphatidylglycerophosphate synthase
MKTHGTPHEVRGITASAEKKLLLWLAARMPGFVTSDLLTLVGFAGTLGAGLAYWQASNAPGFLHVVNLCLFVNWYGDSLDGTLARYRNAQRPRYGYYVDHVADTFGVAALLAGLAASGLMSPAVAAGLLLAYYLVSIEMYLATHSLGVLRIGRAGIGGTELRLILVSLNLAALWLPRFLLFGAEVRLFDAAGAVGILALVAGTLVAAVHNTITLYRLERLPG